MLWQRPPHYRHIMSVGFRTSAAFAAALSVACLSHAALASTVTVTVNVADASGCPLITFRRVAMDAVGSTDGR